MDTSNFVSNIFFVCLFVFSACAGKLESREQLIQGVPVREEKMVSKEKM